MTADGLSAAGREALRPRGRKAQLEHSELRPGWTTGACACAAATSAFIALHDDFPDPVEIVLPGERRAAFALTASERAVGHATAAVTKDAGDDPDVTHGAIIRARVEPGEPGVGVRFFGGPGVGTVTLPGLPLPVGEPAINPMPREYITANISTAAERLGVPADVNVTISIDDGERIAKKTWNSRIGVLGGLSVLGTTGVVVPYSCSAWIASIHRGIDVAVATGARHAAACTGSTSERVAEELHPGIELLDMGDFAGAVLKYLRKHPIPKLTLVGGVAKLSKLAAGYLDLHSHRTRIQPGHLRGLVAAHGASAELQEEISTVATVAHAVTLAAKEGIDLAALIAADARAEALAVLDGAPVEVEVVVIDRAGNILAVAG
ncbi:cobalt-precorrin-5B (C(1))-methyltransferase [Tessaracoccus sp. OH4464_COT-324]|uniref:cobalt-precorrin-5B (C(1))-methyltransferase n=1 Tax=Tessaracoccus sp. OH4464_COT-324 TaxID=2491059 RepID=UPI000F63D794|nr:cobalt-precorrin-5B (C(1))-methyltransferase [Tessaracoccus sp. OH4464_COT-324]RRD45990.1 cobalt-precorrin-5B (C(1))-methyltransferase [Tessaracoccus sp. OH4464_COT-324]